MALTEKIQFKTIKNSNTDFTIELEIEADQKVIIEVSQWHIFRKSRCTATCNANVIVTYDPQGSPVTNANVNIQNYQVRNNYAAVIATKPPNHYPHGIDVADALLTKGYGFGALPLAVEFEHNAITTRFDVATLTINPTWNAFFFNQPPYHQADPGTGIAPIAPSAMPFVSTTDAIFNDKQTLRNTFMGSARDAAAQAAVRTAITGNEAMYGLNTIVGDPLEWAPLNAMAILPPMPHNITPIDPTKKVKIKLLNIAQISGSDLNHILILGGTPAIVNFTDANNRGIVSGYGNVNENDPLSPYYFKSDGTPIPVTYPYGNPPLYPIKAQWDTEWAKITSDPNIGIRKAWTVWPKSNPLTDFTTMMNGYVNQKRGVLLNEIWDFQKSLGGSG